MLRLVYIPRRTIFVAGAEKARTARQRIRAKEGSHADRFLEAEKRREAREEHRQMKRKMRELRDLSITVSQIIREREMKESQGIQNTSMQSTDTQKIQTMQSTDIQKIPNNQNGTQISSSSSSNLQHLQPQNTDNNLYQAITSTIPKNSLVVTPQELPESIVSRLGMAVRFLVTPQKQNWGMVLAQLQAEEGFKNIPVRDVADFVEAIPPKDLKPFVPLVEQMLMDAGIERTNRIIGRMMRGLAAGNTVSDKEMEIIKGYCNEQEKRIRKKNGNEKDENNELQSKPLSFSLLPRETLEILVQAYGKRADMASVNRVLSEMRSRNIEPSPATTMDVLSTCVYKTRSHQHAVEIFDAMKFFRAKPSTRAYQDIIVSHVNHGDVEKALDLYQEMRESHVPMNQRIFVALARGCSSRPQLRLKAWDFIFDIYKHGWSPSLETFEYMLYLSSRDGDLCLSRCLYAQLLRSGKTTRKSFSFLLLAYARYNKVESVLPLHSEGRVFRENIIADTDMASLSSVFPFLPIDTLTRSQVLAESSAVWAHALIHHREYVNAESTTTYLNIACEQGKFRDFKDRWDTTYLENENNESIQMRNENNESIQSEMQNKDVHENIQSEINEDIQENIKTETVQSVQTDAHDVTTQATEGAHGSENSQHIELVEEAAEQTASHARTVPTTSPMLNQNIRIPRVSLMYVVALKAAGKFGSHRFAKQVWTERGQYRKTRAFRELPQKEREQLDFQFAAAMVTCLTQLGLLDDALAVLVSTEYQFRWTWKELDGLNRAAMEIGLDRVCKTVKGIARRAQVKYAGKIRRADYKRYVMERGF